MAMGGANQRLGSAIGSTPNSRTGKLSDRI
jgi:hypothetical protein